MKEREGKMNQARTQRGKDAELPVNFSLGEVEVFGYEVLQLILGYGVLFSSR